MTTILLDKYGLSYKGIKKYAQNRLLRIYPTYLFVALLSFLVIYFLREDYPSLYFSYGFDLPNNLINALRNITLIGLDFHITPRLVPPGWTLFVEVFFYLVIPIVLMAGRKAVSIWLALSIIFHIVCLSIYSNDIDEWNYRYGTIFAGSLGFSLGCATRYFLFNAAINRFLVYSCYFIFIICFLIPIYFMLTGFNETERAFISNCLFYITMISSCFVVNDLIGRQVTAVNKFLGDLSYSLYLCHTIIGYIVAVVFNLKYQSVPAFLAGTSLSIIFSIFINMLVEKNINKIRDKIRKQ